MLKRSLFTKGLCVVLTVLMLVGSLSLGLVFPPAVAKAAETRLASLPMGGLKFIVPEAIYLYPNGSSWTAATSSPFQYYVNNDANNAPITAAANTGKIYYEYAYHFNGQDYGSPTATISYQFVDSSFRALSGGSVTLSSAAVASGGSVDITAGRSPSLAASATGCYILWTLTMLDSVADNAVRKAYALTYVYKPYVVPVGVMVETLNKYAHDSNANQITWISGMHSRTGQSSSTHDGNYYPNYSGDFGMAGFITAGDTAYVGNSACSPAMGLSQNSSWTASASGATKYKLAFLNTSTGTSHFNDTSGNDGHEHDNDAATKWGSGSSSGSTFNVSSFDYWYKNVDPAIWGKQALAAVYATPYGNITVDTSRYSDLAQIPNLGVGMMVVNNRESYGSSWYVADYSTGSRQLGYNGTHTDDSNSDSEKSTYFNDYSYIIAGQGTGSWDNFSGDYNGEGVKYAGAWPRSLQNVPAANNPNDSSLYATTYNYAVKGMFTNADKGTSSSTDYMDYCFAHGTVQLTAKQFNKSTLRTAVQRAISEMPSLGVNGIGSGNITSCYFDANSNYKWTALQLAFKNAVLGLTTLASTSNPNDLAKALNTALDELCTHVTIDPNGGTFTSLVTSAYMQIGDQFPPHTEKFPTQGFRYDPASAGASKPHYTFKGWSADPTSHTGQTYANIGYNGIAYAAWEPVPYTMTLIPADDDNVNTGIKTATYNIESTGTMADIFASAENAVNLAEYPLPRQGWGFDYWEVTAVGEDANWTVGEKIYSYEQISGRYGSVTMKAHWVEGAVDVNVYVYVMNKTGSYLNANNRLVPAETYEVTGARTNILYEIPEEPTARPGFTVNEQKSRLFCIPAANGSSILKIFYDRNQYDVTFVNDNGDVLQAAKKVYFEAAPVYTGATPRKDSAAGVQYTFSGWTDGVRKYTPEELSTYEVTADTTFTAVYSETELLYNVTAAPGEGAVINVEEGTYTYNSVVSVNAEALADYEAAGLKLYANGEEITNPCEYVVTGDVEFTTNDLAHRQTCTVTFYSWDEEMLSMHDVVVGGDASGLQTPPEREGYTFAQWSLPVTNVTADLKVIAQYTKDGATNYTFNFYQDATLLATLVRESGEEFTWPEDVLGLPEKDGYDFMGWDKVFSPAAEDLDVNAVFQANGYVPSYTLTVKFGYEKPDLTYTQESGSTATVEYPERSGYVFTGWTGDTTHFNGTAYTFADADETVTATWYDLTALNAKEGDLNALIAQSDNYRSDYILRLKALVAEKASMIAAVPAAAADLDDLLARMTAAEAQAPDYWLYTLTVLVDGSTVETIRNIAGETVTISAAPAKTGYVFNGWTADVGTVDGSSYTFAASNATATAQFTFDIDALQAEIDALSGDIYCTVYINSLTAKLNEIRTAIENGDSIDTLVEEFAALLGEKADHTHQFTVLSGYAPEPTCTEQGNEVYTCVNGCEGVSETKPVAALGHDWGEWTVTREATLDEDGEKTRTCSRCPETETMTYSLYDGADKVVKFVVMNNMSYSVYPASSPVKINSYTLFKWFSDKDLRFKVNVGADFGYPDYIVYINGVEAYPDTSGYYTVPASPNLSTVSIAGAIPDEDPITGGDSTSKTNFWQWLVNLFRNIANFFNNLFRK